MNIHFDQEELRSVFLEVIRKEFKYNIETTLSQLFRNYAEEERRKTPENIEERITQLHKHIEEVKQTLERLNSQCGILNAELTGVPVSSRNPEEAVGLMEETTLRQVLEETHFEIKSLKAQIQEMRVEMQCTAEVKKKTSEPVPNASSLSSESTAAGGPSIEQIDHAALNTQEFIHSLPEPTKGGTFNGKTIETISAKVPGDDTLTFENGAGQSIVRFERASLSNDEFLRSLPQPTKGDTFNNNTIETISAKVKGPDTLTVEIVNYLDLPLENFRLHLPFGKEHMRAPSSIRSQTREVFTFSGLSVYSQDSRLSVRSPEGVISYKVGGTNACLHLYFHFKSGHVGELAMGYLPAGEPISTFYRPGNPYDHKGEPGSFEHLKTIPGNTTRAITVFENGLYARGTFNVGTKAILTVELFKRNP